MKYETNARDGLGSSKTAAADRLALSWRSYKAGATQNE